MQKQVEYYTWSLKQDYIMVATSDKRSLTLRKLMVSLYSFSYLLNLENSRFYWSVHLDSILKWSLSCEISFSYSPEVIRAIYFNWRQSPLLLNSWSSYLYNTEEATLYNFINACFLHYLHTKFRSNIFYYVQTNALNLVRLYQTSSTKSSMVNRRLF